MKTGAHYGLLTKIKWYAIIKRAVLVMKVCKHVTRRTAFSVNFFKQKF